MTTSSLLNPAYRNWLESKTNPYETILLLEKSEVSDVALSDISEALEEYVRLFKAEIASPAEILTLSRAYPDEEKYSLAVIDKELDQNEPVVVGGPASVEVVDREGHIITLAAMKRAFERFMANFRTRNAMVLHSDVQVGWALPAYISKTGKIYKSGVTGDHLFFITELRDDTKIAKKVLDQIGTGKMKSYSIAGSATNVEPSQRDGAVVMQVNDMELAEVTICEQGVNQKAKFELMKSGTERPTSSCVDGSCLIKSNQHTHSETEVFMDENGIIDTVGSFSNWVQKNDEFNDPQERPRLAPAAIPVHDTDAARRNRERVEADKSKRQVTPWNKHSRRREKLANEPSGNEVLEAMRKSHLEGCLCDSCKQRTGDTNGDDTARPATDRHGRPTLGHTGHGHAVAILISRMHRKARGRVKGWSSPYEKHPDEPRSGAEEIREGGDPDASLRDRVAGLPSEGLDYVERPQGTSYERKTKAKAATKKAGLEYAGMQKARSAANRAKVTERRAKEHTNRRAGLKARSKDATDKMTKPYFYNPSERVSMRGNKQDLKRDIAEGAHAAGLGGEKYGGDGRYDMERGKQAIRRRADRQLLHRTTPTKGSDPRDPDHVPVLDPHSPNSPRAATPEHRAERRMGLERAHDSRHGNVKAAYYPSDYKKPFGQGGGRDRTYDKPVNNMQKAVYEYINKAFEVPSKDELKAAGDKRKAAALAAAKEKHGEDFTPATPKVRPYRGPAAQKTGDERRTAAQDAWRKKNPGKEDPPSFTQQLQAFLKDVEGDATNPSRASTQFSNPKPDIGNQAAKAAEAAKAAAATAQASTDAASSTNASSDQSDPRNLPDAQNGEEPQQQATNLESTPAMAPSGGGRGFFNDLLDLYEGRGEQTRSTAPAPQTPQMTQQLEMSLDYFKNRKGS